MQTAEWYDHQFVVPAILTAETKASEEQYDSQ
jgi:hypothetical protein